MNTHHNHDDDGYVEDEIDETTVLKSTVKRYPELITNTIYSVIEIIENYGWFILLGLLVAYYIYTNFVNRKTTRRPTRTLPNTVSPVRELPINDKKDEETAVQRMMKIEETRRRQQEAVAEAAAKFLSEKKIKDEEKLKDKIEDFERLKEGKSYRSKLKKTDDKSSETPSHTENKDSNKKTPLRPNDYNPLTGGSSSGSGSCNWRPGKRGNSRGG